MKTAVFISFFCILFLYSGGNTFNKTELRNEFVRACLDENKNGELIERLKQIQFQDPLIAAYIGALTAVKAKFSYFPWQKYNYCKAGLSTISQSVLQWPDNLEIRYLRLLIEYKTPKIAGLQNNMEEDKEKILALFRSETDEHLKRIISSFMLGNILCDEKEKDILKTL